MLIKTSFMNFFCGCLKPRTRNGCPTHHSPPVKEVNVSPLNGRSDEKDLAFRLHHLVKKLAEIEKVVEEKSKLFQYHSNEKAHLQEKSKLGKTDTQIGETDTTLSAVKQAKEGSSNLLSDSEYNLAIRLNQLVNKLSKIEKGMEAKSKKLQLYQLFRMDSDTIC